MRDDGGAAFCGSYDYVVGDVTGQLYKIEGRSKGMSLRDYFAAAALPAIISRSISDSTAAIPRLNNGFPIDRSAYADTAYQYADAMIAEREKS